MAGGGQAEKSNTSARRLSPKYTRDPCQIHSFYTQESAPAELVHKRML
jgi:hypothetical protein